MKAFLLASLVLIGGGVWSQTTLPTSFDFVTAPSTVPTGWSTNTTANYGTGLTDDNGSTSRAGKLQATGHHFTIHFYDEPGEVSYYLKSYGTNDFIGTLEVQESEDGSSWNTLTTYLDDDFDNTWTQFTDTPDPDSRYIRIILTNKVSGTNAGLDDVEITQNITTSQEINVTYNGDNVPSTTGIQFSSAVSTPETLNLEIENLGTQDLLMIGAINFSGSAASDYALVSAPSSVSAQNQDDLLISFTPAASGNRIAQLSIASNDANENPYLIDLNGIGGGTATEPTASPTNLTTSTLKTYRIKGGFTASGADGYLAVFRKGESPDTDPVDGTEYTLGEGLGNAKVMHMGSTTTFELREAEADATFHVKVYAYNGSSSFINYRISDPLVDSIITPSASMVDANYYDGIDHESPDFVTDLHDLINPHSVRFYSNYGPDMVGPFLARDTTDGKEVVTAVYSGNNIVYTPPFDWTSTSMNREHTFPSSWMPNSSSNSPQYQDFHHLFQTEATANSQRSNHPFGNVVNVSNSYGDGKVGTDANGNTVYEPRDAQKGDAVRAVFYMQTTYHTSSTSWAIADLNSSGPDQEVDVLVDWHLNDLPSGMERARNDFVDSLQQNRNPYVDSAHWVCYVDFNTVTYQSEPDSTCLALTQASPSQPIDTSDSTIGILPIETKSSGWLFYPNPASTDFFVQHPDGETAHVTVFNLAGKVVLQAPESSMHQLNVQDLPPGFYVLQIANDAATFERIKFSVLR